MSNYKVGDKFIIEIVEGIKGYGNDPNMPDRLNMPVLYRIKGFNALVFDENGLNKLQKLNPHKKIEDIDDMLAEHEIRQKAFNDGMNKALELMRIIYGNPNEGGISVENIKKYFNCGLSEIIFKFSIQEIEEKLEKWRKQESEIKVGDVVQQAGTGRLYVVTNVCNNCSVVLMDNEGHFRRVNAELFKKVGRSIDIKNVISQLEIGGAE